MNNRVSIYHYYNYPESERDDQNRQSRKGFRPVSFLYRQFMAYWLFLPIAFVALMMGLGVWGFYELESVVHSQSDFEVDSGDRLLQAFWQTCGLPLGETLTQDTLDTPGYPIPLQLQIARLFGVLFAFSALVLITWHAITQAFLQIQLMAIKWGPRQYDVICGLGWKSFELARNLRDSHPQRRLVIVEINPQNPFLSEFRDDPGTVVILGDATRQPILKRAGVENANGIYVLGDNDEVNSRITRQIVNLTPLDRTGGESIPCYVHIKDIRTRAYLENNTKDSRASVMCLNVNETTVRRLLMRFPVAPVVDVSEDFTPVHSHVVIFGDTPIAEALVVEQLRTLHLPSSNRVRITWYIEDSHGDGSAFNRKRSAFYDRFPFLNPDWSQLSEWNDGDSNSIRSLVDHVFPFGTHPGQAIEFEPLPLNESGIRSRSLSCFDSLSHGWNVHAYLCLDDGVRSTTLADTLQAGFAAYLGVKADQIPNRAFGEFSEECTPYKIQGNWLDNIGKRNAIFYQLISDANEGKGYTGVSNIIKQCGSATGLATYLHKEWNRIDEWERESNRQLSAHIVVKLRSLGLDARLGSSTLDDTWSIQTTGSLKAIRPKLGLTDSVRITLPQGPAASAYFEFNELPELPFSRGLEPLADMEHRRWCAERLLNGWLPIKSSELSRWEDPESRRLFKKVWHQHADLIPYDRMENQNTKNIDRFFIVNLEGSIEPLQPS